MKTMTCRQLGGPCETEHRAETADQMIKAHDRHLRDLARGGDDTHQDAHEAMKGRWRHPRKSLGWYKDTKRAFAEQPED